MSTRDRAGEGAEVWAFSAETCAGLGVTNSKVAQSDLHLRKLFLATGGLCWAGQRGPGCPQLGVAPASERLFSGTASEGCGRHG